MSLTDYTSWLKLALEDYHPTARQVLRIARRDFGERGRLFLVEEQSWVYLKEFEQLVGHEMARDVTVTFYAGPPKQGKFITSHLVNFFEDLCMRELLVNKDANGAVRKFIEDRVKEDYIPF